jgi:hypothetical protein
MLDPGGCSGMVKYPISIKTGLLRVDARMLSHFEAEVMEPAVVGVRIQ